MAWSPAPERNGHRRVRGVIYALISAWFPQMSGPPDVKRGLTPHPEYATSATTGVREVNTMTT